MGTPPWPWAAKPVATGRDDGGWRLRRGVELPAGFKIGTVSRRTGISSATLRLWEEQYGLLTPQRTAGRQRVYTESDVDRVLYVRELISNRGYSLQGLAAILDEARQSLPIVAQELLSEESTIESRRVVELAAELRAYLEDAHLRMVTNQDQIREGQVLAQIHGVMRRVAQASTFAEAVTGLVTGSAALIGKQPITLAVYQPAEDLLRVLVTASAERILATEGQPVPVAALVPAAFRAAFREGQPYYVRRIPLDELSADTQRRQAASGVQSIYGHPLRAGAQVVGMFMVTSRRVDGVSPEVRGICARVAAISGPTVAYFAAREQPFAA